MTDSDTPSSTGPTERSGSSGGEMSRRTAVKAVGAAAGVFAGAALSVSVTGQETTIRLGGEIAGWRGRSPSAIEGETNPTLEVEAGTEYTITWENLDGATHNVVIEDADGNRLVRTEFMSEQGATQSVTFTAREEMAEYYCEIHPQSMRGDVSVSGNSAEQTPTETPTETPPETETPAETPTETPPETETPAGTPTGTPDGPMMADDACPDGGGSHSSTETSEGSTTANTCAKDGDQ